MWLQRIGRENAHSLNLRVRFNHFHDAGYECNLSILHSIEGNARHLGLKPGVFLPVVRVGSAARCTFSECPRMPSGSPIPSR